MTAPSTNRVRIGLLLVPIATWGLHFLFVYVSAAIVCAKSGDPQAAFSLLYRLIAAGTLLALGITGWTGFRGQADGGDSLQHRATATERRFVGSMLALLSALSAGAIVAVALVSVFFGDCRP